MDNPVFIEFTNKFCFAKDKETRLVLLYGVVKEGLYQLMVSNSSQLVSQSCHANTSQRNPSVECQELSSMSFQINKVDFVMWHRRIGHPCKQVMSKMLGTVFIAFKFDNKDFFCVDCQHGKNCHLNFPISSSRAKGPLDLIHTDVWGPALTLSQEGYRNYIHFLDDFSRFTWLYPLESKSQVYHVFIQFHKTVERQFDRKIKGVQSDWGGEFRPLAKYLQSHGIEFRHPCLYTHQQNGRAERKHRHLV